MAKESSYQKLKKENTKLWDMYVKAVKGELDGDCYLTGFEENK